MLRNCVLRIRGKKTKLFMLIYHLRFDCSDIMASLSSTPQFSTSNCPSPCPCLPTCIYLIFFQSVPLLFFFLAVSC